MRLAINLLLNLVLGFAGELASKSRVVRVEFQIIRGEILERRLSSGLLGRVTHTSPQVLHFRYDRLEERRGDSVADHLESLAD